MEGYGKGSGRPFQRWNFKKKDTVFKALTVGIETILFSYGQHKDTATFIKLNEAMSRYAGVNFKSVGPMAVRAIISATDPYLKLPEDPKDNTGEFSSIKWETELKEILKNKLTWKDTFQKYSPRKWTSRSTVYMNLGNMSNSRVIL